MHEDCLNATSDTNKSKSQIESNESVAMPDLNVSADNSALKGVGGDLQDEPISEKAPTSPRFGQLIADTECKLNELNISDGRRSAREERKQDDEDNSEDEYYDISSQASNDVQPDKDYKENEQQLSDKLTSSHESIADQQSQTNAELIENNPETETGENLDGDEDKRNPQYIPKRGAFYEHDDRVLISDDETTDKLRQDVEKAVEQVVEAEVCDEEEPKVETKNGRKKGHSKWSHDLFDENRQIPKSNDELMYTYGYDIREDDGAPKARRRRRYGRGPNKYTRNWKDETAYGPVPPSKTAEKKPAKKDSFDRKKKESTKDKTNELVTQTNESSFSSSTFVANKSEAVSKPITLNKDKESKSNDKSRPSMDRNSKFEKNGISFDESSKNKFGKGKFDDDNHGKRGSFSDHPNKSNRKFDNSTKVKKEFDHKRRDENSKKRFSNSTSGSLTRNTRSFDSDRKDYNRYDRNEKDRERPFIKNKKMDDNYRSTESNQSYSHHSKEKEENHFNNKEDFPGLPSSDNNKLDSTIEDKKLIDENNYWNRAKLNQKAAEAKRIEAETDEAILVFKTQTFENSRFTGKRFGNLNVSNSNGSQPSQPPAHNSSSHSESRNGIKKEINSRNSNNRGYSYQEAGGRGGNRKNLHDYQPRSDSFGSKNSSNSKHSYHNNKSSSNVDTRSSHDETNKVSPVTEKTEEQLESKPTFGQLDNNNSDNLETKKHSLARQATPSASSASSQAETPTQSIERGASSSPAISLPANSPCSQPISSTMSVNSISFTPKMQPKSDFTSSQSSSARHTPATNNSDLNEMAISHSNSAHSSPAVSLPIVFTSATPNHASSTPTHSYSSLAQTTASVGTLPTHTNVAQLTPVVAPAPALLHAPAVQPLVQPIPSHIPSVPLTQTTAPQLAAHHQLNANPAAVAAHHQSLARAPTAATYYDASRGQSYYADPTRAAYTTYLAGQPVAGSATPGTDDAQMNRYLAQQLAANPYTAAQMAPTAQDQTYLQPYMHHAAHAHHTAAAAAAHQAASYAGYHAAAGYSAYAASHQTYHPHAHHTQAAVGGVPGTAIAPNQSQDYNRGGITYYNVNMPYMNNVGRQMSQRKRQNQNTLPIIASSDAMLQQQYN